MSRQIAIRLDEFSEHFQGLEDPRSTVNQKHPFVSVIMIAVMGVLAGADGPTGIARWARFKAEFLQKHLDLPNGIPVKDVFWRVFAALKPAAFQACFYEWLTSLRTAAEEQQEVTQPHLCIDGKTRRRSHNRTQGLGPLHSVSVWAAAAGLTLAQTACDADSNEITAIPEVLKLVQTKGAVISIDAIGTQTAIAEQIIDGEADYILALIGNHPQLHAAVVEHVAQHMQNDFQDVAACKHTTQETSHGREESVLHFCSSAFISGLNNSVTLSFACQRFTCPGVPNPWWEMWVIASSSARAPGREAHLAAKPACGQGIVGNLKREESRLKARPR